MKKNKVSQIWDELLDVAYISPSPGVSKRFQLPANPRGDTVQGLNNQPWYTKNDHFDLLDQTWKNLPKGGK